MLGWVAADAVGQSLDDHYLNEDRAAGVPQAESHAAVQHGHTRAGRWHKRATAAPIWVNAELVCQHGDDGAVAGFVAILRDRREPHLAALRQRDDAEFLRSVLAASGDCIKVLGLDGRVLLINQGGLRLMDIEDFAAVRGRHWPDFWRGAANFEACRAPDAARAGRLGHFQGAAPPLKGPLRRWAVQVTPIPGADGRPERLLVVSRDITEAQGDAIAPSGQRGAPEPGTWGVQDGGDLGLRPAIRPGVRQCQFRPLPWYRYSTGRSRRAAIGRLQPVAPGRHRAVPRASRSAHEWPG